jgi:hypothetical protein
MVSYHLISLLGLGILGGMVFKSSSLIENLLPKVNNVFKSDVVTYF